MKSNRFFAWFKEKAGTSVSFVELSFSFQELTKLSTQFSNNVLDSTKAFTKVITDPEKVAGLPPTALGLAAQTAKSKVLQFLQNLPNFKKIHKSAIFMFF